MKPPVNLQHERFGELIVLWEAKPKGQQVRWYCRCSCGKKLAVPDAALREGRVKDCGCRREKP